MKKVVGLILIALIIFGAIGGCSDNETEYEKAGKEFSTWTKKDPNTWTKTQRDYLENLLSYKDDN